MEAERGPQVMPVLASDTRPLKSYIEQMSPYFDPAELNFSHSHFFPFSSPCQT